VKGLYLRAAFAWGIIICLTIRTFTGAIIGGILIGLGVHGWADK
jgi:hypothetical protein